MHRLPLARLLLAGAALAGMPTRAAEPLFLTGEPARFTIAGESGPARLAAADLNGDGRTDLVHLGSQLMVFLALEPPPSPSFRGDPYPIPAPAPFLLLGDLDGDGLPEIVTGGASSVQVLRNDGRGGFSEAVGFDVDLNPRAAALADLDQDGHLDVVTANQPASGLASLSVLRGDGGGGFERQVRRPIAEDALPHAMVIDDFDLDGALDVAVAIVSSESRIAVFRGEGGTRLGDPVDTPIPANPRVIAKGEFGGDDLIDLAVLAEGPDLAMSQVYLLENAGGGGFNAELVGEDEPLGRQAYEVLAVEDADEDGLLDIITQFHSNGLHGLRTRHGSGSGDFPRLSDRILGEATLDFLFTDVSGDGVRDLAASHGSSLAVFRGLAPGRLELPRTMPLSAAPRGVLALDWSGDGAPDLVAGGAGAYFLIRSQGADAFEAPIERPAAGSLEALTLGDFDGDGAREPAFADTAGGKALLVFLDPSGGTRTTVEAKLGDLPSGLAAGDFDGDGRDDLAAADLASPLVRVVLDPAREPVRRTVELDAGSPQTALDAGDLDEDGAVDVAVSTRSGLRIFLGDGQGAFPRSRDLGYLAGARQIRIARGAAGEAPSVVGVAALGAALLRIREPLGAGAPPFDEVDDGSEFTSAALLDLDGDGLADLVSTARRPANALEVRRGLDGGAFGAPEPFAVGIHPVAFDLVDLGGDGLLEAVTADFGSKSLTVLEGAGGQRSSGGRPFRRGDAEADGRPVLTDAIVILEYLFRGGDPLACEDAADTDDSGVLDVTDAIALLEHLFRGGPEPPAPGLIDCGPDPTPDPLRPCAGECP